MIFLANMILIGIPTVLAFFLVSIVLALGVGRAIMIRDRKESPSTTNYRNRWH